jgi:hypothetical protein
MTTPVWSRHFRLAPFPKGDVAVYFEHFPSDACQAEFSLESYDIDGLINLDLPDTEVHRRVFWPRLCSQCGFDCNPIAHRLPPARPAI